MPDVVVAERITDAANAVAAALSARPREELRLAQSKCDLHRAVDGARGLGMSWGTIGALLGISRGAAIKRYHHPGQRISTTRFENLPL